MYSLPCTRCNVINVQFPDSSILCSPTDGCVTCAKIKDRKRQIDDARRLLNELIEDMERMAAGFNAEHDRLCRTLPTELVSEVFLHALPLSPSIEIFKGLKFRDGRLFGLNRTLWLLGSICHQWRTIARRTPALWKVLAWTPRSHGRDCDISVFQDWLGLSGELPLYLYLQFYDDNPWGDCQTHLPEISSDLLSHLPRSVALQIQAPNKELSRFFSDCAHLPLRLQHLAAVSEGHIHLHLMTAPCMLAIPSRMAEISFSDWKTLRELHLSELYEDEFLQILQKASNLSKFKVDSLKEEVTEFLDIVHDNLQTLSISNSSQMLWNLVCFPGLRTLKLRMSPGVDYSTAVIALVQRSRCRLHSLHYYSKISEENLIQLIAHMPTLVHLNLSTFQAPITDFFFRRITHPLTSGPSENIPVLPFLESLDCKLLNAETFDWGALVAFLEVRSRGRGGRLRSLKIDSRGSLGEGFCLNKDLVLSLLDAASGVDLFSTSIMKRLLKI